MRFTICFAGLLVVFVTPALAGYNINISGDDSNIGRGQQSESVNNDCNVAIVDKDNGWDSWNTTWDYETGYAATRSFAKKSCIVHKMNKRVMPSIQALDTLVKEKKLQGTGPEAPPPKGLVLSVKPSQVEDLNVFGKSIVSMCKGILTYTAEEIQGASLFVNPGRCLNVTYSGFWIPPSVEEWRRTEKRKLLWM